MNFMNYQEGMMSASDIKKKVESMNAGARQGTTMQMVPNPQGPVGMPA